MSIFQTASVYFRLSVNITELGEYCHKDDDGMVYREYGLSKIESFPKVKKINLSSINVIFLNEFRELFGECESIPIMSAF